MTFDVHPSRLAFYDEAMHFVVEPGLFRFAVGASSSDIRQCKSVGGILHWLIAVAT